MRSFWKQLSKRADIFDEEWHNTYMVSIPSLFVSICTLLCSGFVGAAVAGLFDVAWFWAILSVISGFVAMAVLVSTLLGMLEREIKLSILSIKK